MSNDTGEDRFDGWSPDGSRLVFSSDRSGSWDVYVVRNDGTGFTKLTTGAGTDWNALWVNEG